MYEETQVLDSLKVQPYYNSLAYDIFIDEGIDSPAYYRSVISTLNKANENDHVNLIINSGGGLVSTASAIIHAMDRCKAKITAHLVGDCCSAATMISLHADEWEVSENVTYMVHTCSFGVVNSAEKVKDHHDFIQESNRATMYREYSGLLTDEEIEQCLAGKEWWFNKEQLENRLRNFVEHKTQQQASAMEEMYTFQDEQADKYEKILVNKLLEKGVITKEEADIAYKVQQASLKLDEEEGDQLITALNKPVAESEPSAEDFLVLKGDDCDYGLYYQVVDGDVVLDDLVVDGEVVLGDSVFDSQVLPLTLACAEEYYSVLKAVSADLNVSKSHNIKPENLMKKLIDHLEQLVEESL